MDSLPASGASVSRRRARRVLPVAVLACLALSRPASASGPVDEFDHPNVTWYDRPAAEAAAPEALSVQTGTVDPTEGCIVSAPSVSADDYSEGVTVTNTEVAYDPDACKSLYLRVESADEQSSSGTLNGRTHGAYQ